MNECHYQVLIEALSPIHLSSGQADVTVDAEVVHDAAGLPFFPAKRLKGLLYESALEVAEMWPTANSTWDKTLQELFRHGMETKVQLIVYDFHIPEYEAIRDDLLYLEKTCGKFFQPEDVLAEFSSLRYQTAIDENGIAKDSSLHNMRVLDKGICFEGELVLMDADPEHERLLLLALRNLHSAGMKRNRGFGSISCRVTAKDGSPMDMDQLIREALNGEVKSA